MASPQLENGYIKIATDIAEALAKVNLSAYESRVLWCVFRKTYGWNKKSDRISYSQYQEATGIKRRHLGRTLKSLIARQIIVCSSDGQQLEYAIQKNFEKWQPPLPKEVIVDLASAITPTGNSKTCANYYLSRAELLPLEGELLPKEVTKLLPKEVNTKDNKRHYTKDNIQKKGDIFILPEWINKETWEAFKEMRKSKKKPMTDYATKLIINILDRLRKDGEDPNLVLEQSIINSWTSVFSLKGGNNGANQKHLEAARTGNYTKPPAYSD